MSADQALTRAIAELLEERFGEKNAIPFKWLVMAEYLDEDAQRLFVGLPSEDLKTWEARGFLTETLGTLDACDVATQIGSDGDDD